jgi:hypothetical protein
VGGGASGGRVAALTVFDDGTGPALYAGGKFTTIGGVSAARIARWDGASWAPLGAGITGSTTNDRVEVLQVFDDGSGPALFAGGLFDQAGGQPASSIARWDGANWSALPPGPAYAAGLPQIASMTVFDDGQGPALYVGGYFDAVAGVPIPNPPINPNCLARYDGSSWSVVPSQYLGKTLAVFDDGGGPDLYVGVDLGSINTTGSIHRLTCTGTTSITATQPGGPGAPLHINNANLSPGREYYNIISVEIVGLPGSGPFLGLHASPGVNLDFLVLQAQLPVGTPPFHFVAPASYLSWGPFYVGPTTIDAVCFDFTGGIISAVSPVARITIL